LGNRLASLAVVVAVLTAAPAAEGVLPTLYVDYNTADCTFKLTNDAGTTFTAVGAGTYQVVINTSDPYGVFDQSGRTDLMACKGYVKFRLTGPGVSIYTTLDYGDAASELYPATFQAGGTYTIQDDTNIAGTRRSFTASAAPAATPTTQPPKGSPGTAETLPLRGRLDAAVSSSGTVVLLRKGKAIGALKTGRYTFAVHDQSKRAGFSIQAPKGKKQAVTSAAFVGWRDLVVALEPGRWAFFTPGGKKSPLLVVS
jgi:hypothetical protein